MSAASKQLWTKLQQMGSYLLVVFFLFISIGQLFHLHTDAYPAQDTLYGDNERIQLADKCSVCDYYHHVQGKQALLFYPKVETILNPEAITLNTRILTGNYEHTLQVIANKGPPNSH